MLRIVTFRDPDSEILFKPTHKIEFFNNSLLKFAKQMEETLLANDGLGLAANQVNRDVALCVVRKKSEIQFLCNPEIIEVSAEQEKMEEGCLSFPNVFLDISRPKKVTVSFKDLKGRTQKLKASGILARTLQHEIDHLNGMSFIEKSQPC